MRALFCSKILLCAIALIGCSDHRLGYFPVTESDGASSDGTTVTTLSPTTLSPTTVSPTTVSPTTLPPTTEPPTTGPTSITSETDTATVTSDPTATSGGSGCGELVLGTEVPQTVFFSLAGQDDAFSLSCGGIGGSDLALLWTAPFSGRFVFDTSGSNFDSLLGLLAGACFGPEIACDDDSGSALNARVEAELAAGQTVTIVVDSFTQGFGEVRLEISHVDGGSCPDTEFPSQVPIEMPGQTKGAPNVRHGGCDGFDAPEIEALWVPPFDGVFRFEVIESDFDPVMYLRAGGCDGPELACNDDFDGLNPGFDVLLVGGQPVVVVVDGHAGSAGKFTLRIREL
ncbi:MAG TPA: hypothetical protein VIK91_24990 [Nannocystis sp.]